MTPDVCILDYGSGNVMSVRNLFATMVENVKVSNDPAQITSASHLVLPGVGAFGASMERINNTLPLDLLTDQVFGEKKPFLGICVGMQVLATNGEEFGSHEGLNWIPGVVRKLKTTDQPLPHIGWNNIIVRCESELLTGFAGEPDFYFVHSFIFEPKHSEDVAATCDYGEEFAAVLQHENIYGVQFHPEKSQKAGMQLIRNFLSMS
jgi:imidazole glycerol-phosphate synthase subunit HisH